MLQISRFLYEMHNGKIPNGLVIRHKCDNPGCIRIDHLEIGTKADNNHDRHIRGRDHRNPGEKNGNASLKEFQVIEVLKNSQLPLSHFAKKFGVNKTTIQQIRNRNTWQHLG